MGTGQGAHRRAGREAALPRRARLAPEDRRAPLRGRGDPRRPVLARLLLVPPPRGASAPGAPRRRHHQAPHRGPDRPGVEGALRGAREGPEGRQARRALRHRRRGEGARPDGAASARGARLGKPRGAAEARREPPAGRHRTGRGRRGHRRRRARAARLRVPGRDAGDGARPRARARALRQRAGEVPRPVPAPLAPGLLRGRGEHGRRTGHRRCSRRTPPTRSATGS